MRSLISLIVAVLVTVVLANLVMMTGNTFLYGTPLPKPEAPKVVVADPAAPAPAATAEAAKPFEYATYAANAANGEKVFGKCKACHTGGNGEPNRTGPNLFGIVGRKVAAHEGFAYSDAMKGKAAELDTWSEEHLFTYLESPKTLVPGTKMAFAGLKSPEERADLIAYLKGLK